MANVIEVVLKVIDEMTGQIQDIAQGTEEQTGGMAMSFTELNSVLSLAQQGFQAIAQVYDETIGLTVEYNKSVLDLAQSVGTTTEEMSRLIQVADDFGIEQGTLEVALQMMTKNGLQPTIDNLANLADQLNAIENPTERAKIAAELLGRNWSALTPMFSAGGAAIRTAADGISENLIVTEESAKASEKWRLQVDALNDSLTGLKITLGSGLIKVLSDAAFAFQMLWGGEGVAGYMATLQAHNDELLTTTTSYDEYSAEMTRALDYLNYTVDAEGNVTSVLGQHAGTLRMLTEEQYNNMDINAQMAAGYKAMHDSVLGLDGSMSGLNATLYTANDLMKGYNDQLLFSIASQGLSEEAAIDLAESMGLIDEKTKLAYDATAMYKDELANGAIPTQQEYNDRIAIMQGLLDGLDGKKYKTTFELDAIIDEKLYEWYDFLDNQNQSGGSGGGEQEAAGGSWTIPSGYGYEGFYLGAGHYASPGETVTVTPAGEAVKPGGGGATINVTVVTELDYEELLYRLRDDLARSV
jgi:hypothetical protein